MNALSLWADNFTPLRSRDIRVYLSGQSVSLIGTFVQQTALGLLVYRLSNSSAVPLGILSACNALPLMLLSSQPLAALLVGGLADRIGAPRAVALAGLAAVLLSMLLLQQQGWVRWRLDAAA